MNVFQKAHKMTRKIVDEYGVDYKVQFKLCLLYILEEEQEVESEEKLTPVEYTIINIWANVYGRLQLVKQWKWDKNKDWKKEFLKRWGNFNGSQYVKDIVYESQGLRIALAKITSNTDYTMVLGHNLYDESNYRSIDFKQSTKRNYRT